MRCLIPILLFPLFLFAQPNTGGGVASGGAPPQPPPTPTTDLAAIEGQVSDAIGGTPLLRASISMNRVNNGPNTTGPGTYSATTDASGHYTISGIEPGKYRLNASHTLFLGMEYNERRPGGAGTELDLGRSEKKTGVDFHLTPESSVSGKITDENDEPLEGVQIQLFRLTYVQGRKQLQQNNSANTNDLGEFRLYGVWPGRPFYLAATYHGGMAPNPASGPNQEEYATTFYPGVTDFSAASLFDLRQGEQAQGINIRLRKIQTVRVSGRAVNNAAPPPPPEPAGGRGGVNGQVNGAGPSRIQVRLEPRGGLNPMGWMPNSVTQADGKFEFPSVPPGSYDLLAFDNQSPRPHFARQPIDVGNANLEGLGITISPGATVTGRVRYDGNPPATPPSLNIRLIAREVSISSSGPAKVAPDGSFEFDDVQPDIYDVLLNLPPCDVNPQQCFYVKSLRSASTDVLASGLDLSSGAAALDVLLGTNPPQVSGSVLNANTEQPAPAATVVLIPREKERQNREYFYQSKNTDQYGNVSFLSVPPGEYQAFAWEDVQYGQWFDAAWMKTYASKGQTLIAQEGTPVNVKLTLIPAK